jgi:hypothetical protein
MKITDEMIENAAEAVDKAISLLKNPSWSDANDRRKDLCRRAALAAIESIERARAIQSCSGVDSRKV